MTKLLSFSFLCITFFCLNAYSRLIPEVQSEADALQIGEKFAHILAANTPNQIQALGVDYEFGASSTYSNNRSLAKTNSSLKDESIDSILFIRKGLYWNFDAGISFVAPISSNILNGYSFGLTHSLILKNKTSFKTSLSLFDYNINDLLNQKGFSLILSYAFKTVFLKWDIGLSTESLKSSFKNHILNISSRGLAQSTDFDSISSRGFLRLAIELKDFKLYAASTYKNKDNFNASLGFTKLF